MDHRATVQLFFSLAKVRCFWRCFCFRRCFPEDVWVWWLLMHWLQLQFTPCEALLSIWIDFARQYSQSCGHPCCLCTFSYTISFSNEPLWLTLFVGGVNDRLLDCCQLKSTLLWFQRTRDTQNVYCMDGHLMKLKCKYSSILRYWIFDFHEL